MKKGAGNILLGLLPAAAGVGSMNDPVNTAAGVLLQLDSGSASSSSHSRTGRLRHPAGNLSSRIDARIRLSWIRPKRHEQRETSVDSLLLLGGQRRAKVACVTCS